MRGMWRRLVRWFKTSVPECSGEIVTLGGGTGMEQDALEHWGKPCPVHDERKPECTATEMMAGTAGGSWFGHAGSCPRHGNTVIDADRALAAELEH